MSACLLGSNDGDRAPWEYAIIRVHVPVARLDRASTFMAEVVSAVAGHWPLLYDLGWDADWAYWFARQGLPTLDLPRSVVIHR